MADAKIKTAHFVAPRQLLIGVIAGVVLFCVALAGFNMWLPKQDAQTSDRNYGYVYSGTKSCSVAFNTASDADDSMLLFGSSELSTPASLVPQVPTAVFGGNNYGLNLTYVGEAYDQSLWQAIAAGAYAEATQNKKVAIVVSPGWFEDGGMDNETFGMRFNYSLYRAFCDNPNISDSTKAFVAHRLHQQGIDSATVNAGLRNTPMDYANDIVFAAMDDLKLRKELMDVREKGIEKCTADASKPDFEKLNAQAKVDAEARSTNNEMGIDDDYWTNNLDGQMERLKDSDAKQTYTDTPEYGDFACFLKVCRETGLEPLVIISPIHGDFYDHRGVSKSVRNTCYQRVRNICEQAGVQVADFSDKEYEKYFLHDIVHFGGPGWVAVEEALYDFAK